MKKIGLIIIFLSLLTSLGYCQEEEYYSCAEGADCVLFSPGCCSGCSPSHSVNKQFLKNVESKRKEKCAGFDADNLCPQIECMPLAHEAYCDENKHCARRIDCERTCELMEASGFDQEYALKTSQCQCENLSVGSRESNKR